MTGREAALPGGTLTAEQWARLDANRRPRPATREQRAAEERDRHRIDAAEEQRENTIDGRDIW